MARTARLFIANACYHIMVRANQGSPVFRDEADFGYYLKLMHKYKIRCDCLIYAYCLMKNHVHILLEAPLGLRSMSSFMHGINQSYAMMFNKKYAQVGHVWQNRYKNFVVLKDDYLVSLISYIELNPLRANIVLKPEDYRWSSYSARALGKKDIILDELKLSLVPEMPVGTGLG